ncbi:MAG: glutamate 5-kinase [Dehalococcoidales bacterium]|nr:glutamate 5-kinase [Dehalococcoidales bacterium]
MVKDKKKTKTVYNRIVIKLGTSLLTNDTSHLNHDMMAKLVAQIARLHRQGCEIIIVSSGAIASGKDKLGLPKKVNGIPYKQVCSSVGQSRLMNTYEQLFDPYNITIAQGLLTKTNLKDRSGYLNTRNTLLALMELGVISIINENDMVAVDEIKEAKFGDNDNLSAMVANMVDADLLLILTEVDGLFTADPHTNADAKLIPEVEHIDSGIERLAKGTTSKLGMGGMITKIEAARLATDSGVAVIIANGRIPDILPEVISGEKLGTLFKPVTSKLDSRDRWMLSGLSTKGKIIIDDGAAEALKKQKRSLLAAGIKKVDGKFQRGDIINIQNETGATLGAGITNYSAQDINIIKGMQSQKIATMLGCDYGAEVIHRNNLVIL